MLSIKPGTLSVYKRNATPKKNSVSSMHINKSISSRNVGDTHVWHVEYILQAMWKELSISVSSPMKYKKIIHMTKNTMNTVLIVLFSPRIQYM
jgi:hypothetical protein